MSLLSSSTTTRLNFNFYKRYTFYFIQLHPWSILVNPPDTTTSPEEDEDTKYADIYIPVPYDPEIPGVRCVDAEEVENVDVAIVTSLSEDGGENVELQDLGKGDDLGDVEDPDLSLIIEQEPPEEDNLLTGDMDDVV